MYDLEGSIKEFFGVSNQHLLRTKSLGTVSANRLSKTNLLIHFLSSISTNKVKLEKI